MLDRRELRAGHDDRAAYENEPARGKEPQDTHDGQAWQAAGGCAARSAREMIHLPIGISQTRQLKKTAGSYFIRDFHFPDELLDAFRIIILCWGNHNTISRKSLRSIQLLRRSGHAPHHRPRATPGPTWPTPSFTEDHFDMAGKDQSVELRGFSNQQYGLYEGSAEPWLISFPYRRTREVGG